MRSSILLGLVVQVVFSIATHAQEVLEKRVDELAVLGKQRESAIARLIEIVNAPVNPMDPIDKWGAINLLGDYRDPIAIPVLLREITFRTGRGRGTEPRDLANFPAAEALVRIGEPAVKELITSLDNPLSAQQIRLYAFTLDAIYTKDHRSALVFRLKHELNSIVAEELTIREARTENLKALIRYAESSKLDDPKEGPAFRDD